MDYTSTYSTSRVISQIISFMGWVLTVIGCISCIIIWWKIGALSEMIPGTIGIGLGLTLVMSGQMSRALLDTSDNTGEMLALMKNERSERVILLTDEVKK